MTLFVCDVLVHFKIPPSQLTLGAWRPVLGFEALCAAFAPATYEVEEFAPYTDDKVSSGCSLLDATEWMRQFEYQLGGHRLRVL